MKKRRQGQLVQLKIRLRERLRERLEYAAKQEEIPLSHEIVRRLENSFDQQQLFVLLEYMLAPGMGMDLFKALAEILADRPNWQKSDNRHVIAAAIYKVIAAYIGEIPATAESFPERSELWSADRLAWDALFVHLRHLLPPLAAPDDRRRLIEQQARQRQELRQVEDERQFKALAPRTLSDQEPDLPLAPPSPRKFAPQRKIGGKS
jgi:hypothetical protein